MSILTDDRAKVITILEANLNGLLNLRGSDFTTEPTLYHYLQFLIGFYSNQSTVMEFHIEKLPNWLQKIARVRMQICQLNVDPILLEDVEQEKNLDPIWRGEALFYIAMAWMDLNQYEKAQGLFLKATLLLEQNGLYKKSLEALFNNIVCETHLYPEKKLLTDYLNIYQKSIQRKIWSCAGMALLNISREYQLIGALDVALNYAHQSLEIFEREEWGMLNYYLALVHRSQLFFQLNRIEEAEFDYQKAQIADFPEITAALKILRITLHKKNIPNLTLIHNATPTWKERLENPKTSISLTKKENQILDILGRMELTKEEIISAIYGNKICFSSAENRWKVLLCRIRKKIPGIIIFENNKYKLADTVYLNKIPELAKICSSS